MNESLLLAAEYGLKCFGKFNEEFIKWFMRGFYLVIIKCKDLDKFLSNNF